MSPIFPERLERIFCEWGWRSSSGCGRSHLAHIILLQQQPIESHWAFTVNLLVPEQSGPEVV